MSFPSGWNRRLFQAYWREPRILLVLLVVAGAGWTFTELADEVVEGETRTFDERLLLAFRTPGAPGDPVGPAWVEEMARDITALGSIVVLVFAAVAAIAYLLMVGKRGAALLVMAAVGGGALISTVLKAVFDRARPDLVPHAMQVFTESFPSGHAMLSAVTWLTLGTLLMRMEAQRRVKVYFLVLALVLTLAVGTSRIYLGVHWPTDVLAGWTVGAAWALGCWALAEALQRRGRVEPDVPGTEARPEDVSGDVAGETDTAAGVPEDGRREARFRARR